jgi:hypothetical protein
MIDTDYHLTNVWEKARAVSTIVATVVIPLAIALSSNWYGQQQKDKEVQLEYIELAIQILSAPLTDSNQAVRKGAINTINRYSEVKIDAQAKDELLKQQLRRIIDSYNKTAKGIIDNMGR